LYLLSGARQALNGETLAHFLKHQLEQKSWKTSYPRHSRFPDAFWGCLWIECNMRYYFTKYSISFSFSAWCVPFHLFLSTAPLLRFSRLYYYKSRGSKVHTERKIWSNSQKSCIISTLAIVSALSLRHNLELYEIYYARRLRCSQNLNDDWASVILFVVESF
jgi:hypothetical protein